MFGVNLSGAEFGSGNRYGWDYIYPSSAEIQYYASKGVDTIRLPVQWERLQPVVGGALNMDEVARIQGVLTAAQTSGVKVVLDLHNYGGYAGQLVGQSAVTIDNFVDLWSKVASVLKTYPALGGYGLMNEPNGFNDPNTWPTMAQKAIDAIRAVDTKTSVYVMGQGWGAAETWLQINDNLKYLKDSANNLVFEAHQYFDRWGSGTYAGTYDSEGAYAMIGVDRVQPFLKWLKDNNLKGFIGEYSIPDNDPRWIPVMQNFLAELAKNGVASAYWGGGPWWGSYPMSIEPENGTDSVQMQVLSKSIQAYHDLMLATQQPPPPVTIPLHEVVGTKGNDTLTGWTGYINKIQGGLGNDKINGADKNDELYGGDGNDTLHGMAGNDILFGDSGFDVIYGDAGDDTIDGGSGDDRMYGGDGNDVIKGGLGVDTLYGDAGDDTLDGGAGTDYMYGGTGNDSLFGGDDSDRLDGESGDDLLDGGNGHDTMYGGDGNDMMMGGAGNDTMYGGSGVDKMLGGDGADKMWGDGGADQIWGGAGADVIYVGDGDDVVYGEGDNDYVSGGSGNDLLYGGDGNDKMYGDAGDDILDGGAGNDNLTGGEGNDKIFGGDGNDWMYGEGGDDYMEGGNGDDPMSGGDGNDIMIGGDGKDVLYGGNGNDFLSGGAGVDRLYGDGGDDILLAGAGNDYMWGGAGKDTFVFKADSAFVDLKYIEDFGKTSGDRIDISNLLQGYDPVTKAITDFVQITTKGRDSILSVDVDGGGDHFMTVALIRGVTGLTDEDALLKSGNLVAQATT